MCKIESGVKEEAKHNLVMKSGTCVHSTMSYYTQIRAAYDENDTPTDKIVLSQKLKN